MKYLYIIKLGDTFPNTALELGDFEQWVANGINSQAVVVDPRTGAELPAPDQVLGAILTGSHTMVTERPLWSERTGQWLSELLDLEVPVLGICYGHQLLAQALGGEVDFHPGGMEIGTVDIHLEPAAATDPLFSELPSEFYAHVTHSQSVRRLPPNAVRLAGNPFEPNQAYRVGPCAWGLQFHPEFNAKSMNAYLQNLAPVLHEKQIDAVRLQQQVKETPAASQLLERFARLAGHSRFDARGVAMR